MKLEFTTTGKKIEKVSWLLSLAINAARGNEKFRYINGINEKDLDQCESFRKQMVKGYFRKFKNK